jgi:succinate dehydrogenase/fumarate reductase-like Fe-S protein
MFCGMGICYECLVTINGVPGQRACMCRVEPGMEIVLDEA